MFPVIWRSQAVPGYLVFSSCSRLSGVLKLFQVIWCSQAVPGYLVFLRCSRLSGVLKLFQVIWCSQAVPGYLMFSSCSRFSGVFKVFPVIWYSQGVPAYLVLLRYSRLSGVLKLFPVIWCSQAVPGYLVFPSCSRLSGVLKLFPVIWCSQSELSDRFQHIRQLWHELCQVVGESAEATNAFNVLRFLHLQNCLNLLRISLQIISRDKMPKKGDLVLSQFNLVLVESHTQLSTFLKQSSLIVVMILRCCLKVVAFIPHNDVDGHSSDTVKSLKSLVKSFLEQFTACRCSERKSFSTITPIRCLERCQHAWSFIKLNIPERIAEVKFRENLCVCQTG